MWCKQCRQDVPGIPAQAGESLRCLRCGAGLISGRSAAPAHMLGVGSIAAHGVSLEAPRAEPRATPKVDEWASDRQLEQIRRFTREHRHTVPAARSDSHSGLAPPHISLTGVAIGHRSAPGEAEPAKAEPRRVNKKRASSLLAWLVLGPAMMAFVCGGALLGFSHLAGRADLWNLGLPVLFGGQFALLVGLVLLLDSLWHNNRQTADKLDEVDDRLHDLNRTTVMLGTTHTTAAQAFYTHLAEGAHPQLLLADLKSQLDLLAVRMTQRN